MLSKLKHSTLGCVSPNKNEIIILSECICVVSVCLWTRKKDMELERENIRRRCSGVCSNMLLGMLHSLRLCTQIILRIFIVQLNCNEIVQSARAIGSAYDDCIYG